MTITINDSFAEQVIAFLKTLPRDAVKIEKPTQAWYANEVQRRIEEYKQGDMETIPWNEGWEEIEEFLDTLDKNAS